LSFRPPGMMRLAHATNPDTNKHYRRPEKICIKNQQTYNAMHSLVGRRPSLWNAGHSHVKAGKRRLMLHHLLPIP
jgi:hypothetical protein